MKKQISKLWLIWGIGTLGLIFLNLLPEPWNLIIGCSLGVPSFTWIIFFSEAGIRGDKIRKKEKEKIYFKTQAYTTKPADIYQLNGTQNSHTSFNSQSPKIGFSANVNFRYLIKENERIPIYECEFNNRKLTMNKTVFAQSETTILKILEGYYSIIPAKVIDLKTGQEIEMYK